MRDPLRVVIAGGGVAALEALVGLKTLAEDRVASVVIAATDAFVYRPLELGEPFGRGAPRRYPLSELCAPLGAELHIGMVRDVDPAQRVVRTAGGAEFAYDVLLLATGAHADPAFEHAVSFDREHDAADFDELLGDLDEGLAPHVAIVVPDGVAWSLPAYEVALLTVAWAEERGLDDTRVSVVTHEAAPLDVFGARASAEVLAALERAGVDLHTGVHPDVVSPGALRIGGHWMEADRIVSLPVAHGPRLEGIPRDVHGFIPVDARSRVVGLADVYAAGDGTTTPIRQGGLAAQQAAVAAAHIAATAGADVQPQPLRPVLRGLLPTSHGPLFLRAELDDPDGTSTAADAPLWWPPSKISTRFLAPHLARLEAEQRWREAERTGALTPDR
ncbi:MAG: FAD-dependent oxidoreductase [Solirubrobacteraceae bacterium]|nr:FAD-dependent oxidoreductase [Solirubrobacteraceae bacterium]